MTGKGTMSPICLHTTSLCIELPGYVVDELWKEREHETLDRFVWRKFKDITDEVIRALSHVDPEEVRQCVKTIWY